MEKNLNVNQFYTAINIPIVSNKFRIILFSSRLDRRAIPFDHREFNRVGTSTHLMTYFSSSCNIFHPRRLSTVILFGAHTPKRSWQHNIWASRVRREYTMINGKWSMRDAAERGWGSRRKSHTLTHRTIYYIGHG